MGEGEEELRRVKERKTIIRIYYVKKRICFIK